jgi:hypothetical protein
MPNNTIENPRPTYEVSVGAAFFCPIIERTNTEILFEDIVTRQDVVKELGITPTTIEQEIWASGVLFDYISQTTGADIALQAVALDRKLLIDLSGAKQKEGFVFDRVNDLEREFAFGYYGENRDGTLVFYWHPLCKIVAGEESKSTRTNDPPDPQKNYNVKVMPFGSGEMGGVWRVRYDQSEAKKAGLQPLTIEEFFSQVIYREDQTPTPIPIDPTSPTDPPVSG